MKWTPGPWAARRGGGHATLFVEGPSGNGDQVPRTWLVAEVSGRDLPTNEANARLIAAAPEMAALLAEVAKERGTAIGLNARGLLAKVNGDE